MYGMHNGFGLTFGFILWTHFFFLPTGTVFEHMKNYNDLLEKVHGFLKPEGKLFVHIFTHKDYAYQFEE